MTGEGALCHVRERVAAERSAVAARADGLETFADRLESLSPTRATRKRTTQTVGGQLTTGGGGDRRSAVRDAFAETVGPHAEADSTLGAVRTELGDGVALALAPTTQTVFTPELRSQLLAATRERMDELAVTGLALRREAGQVESVADTVTDLVTRLQTADETPLSALGFDALRARHDRLDAWERELAAAAERRQSFLHGTTSDSGRVGVTNRDLVRSLYEDFAAEYPALSTVADLHGTFEDCRSAVRDHLVRRA
jgi:hypothetical protein